VKVRERGRVRRRLGRVMIRMRKRRVKERRRGEEKGEGGKRGRGRKKESLPE